MSSRHYREQQNQERGTPSSSGTNTPPLAASYLPTSVSHAVTGLLRRFSTDPTQKSHGAATTSTPHFPVPHSEANGLDGVYRPPYRTASPYQPPPLYPVALKGYEDSTSESARLLSKALAEEIRLLFPPRLQLCEEWNIVYSLEQDGVSLGTLYKKCYDLCGLRNGYVLVVRDAEGGLFGAYLTEAPHPSPHYFGTGECFLWRASILTPSSRVLPANLPPPPSTNTTNISRSTTIAHTSTSSTSNPNSLLSPTLSIPEGIRFKAFPYSGKNDYLMLCDTRSLSIGGGDGHYGLWLDDSFERGISSHCLTFRNEPLSEEGEKFGILGVELWSVGTF